MARRSAEDVENITNAILASGVTVEHQADALRRHDLEAALKIIERHPIMHGVGMRVEDVGRPGLQWRATLPTPSPLNGVGCLPPDAPPRAIIVILTGKT
jgi:hypothetical protein